MPARSAPIASRERRGSPAAVVVLAVVGLAVVGLAQMVAAAPLDLTAESQITNKGVSLHVSATNHASSALTDVHPEVAYERETHRGDPLGALAPGETHAWTFTLPPPSAPGAFPATVRLAYRIGERAETRLIVHLVVTPGAPPTPVETALTVAPVAGYGHAHLTLDNGGDQPVVGRVVVLLPPALTTEPESRPVQIGAHARTEVPFDVRNQNAVAGDFYPLFVLFEYESEGVHQTLLRTATLEVQPTTNAPVRPLVVGVFATLFAVMLVLEALRRTRHATTS